MLGAFQSLAVVAGIVGLGSLLGRSRILSDRAEGDLARLVLTVLLPCLVLTMLVDGDLGSVFSPVMAASLAASVVIIGLYVLIARVALRRGAAESLIGALAAGLPNVGNIGIPVSAYMLGSAAYAVPVVLVQSALLMPLSLVVLDVLTQAPGSSIRRTLVKALVTPLLIASVVGVLILVLGVTPPQIVLEPFRVVGAAAVPVTLIAFGLSLAGHRGIAAAHERTDIVVAVVLKLVVMPIAAWLLARFGFGMSGMDLVAVTVLAALPTAQNVVVIARRYGRGESAARDTTLLTTIGVIPVLLGLGFVRGW